MFGMIWHVGIVISKHILLLDSTIFELHPTIIKRSFRDPSKQYNIFIQIELDNEEDENNEKKSYKKKLENNIVMFDFLLP